MKGFKFFVEAIFFALGFIGGELLAIFSKEYVIAIGILVLAIMALFEVIRTFKDWYYESLEVGHKVGLADGEHLAGNYKIVIENGIVKEVVKR